ncbi:DUF389 domain-containing protein [Marmoricola sp. RAF53]|uniref:DUF389 domain-containing protein n=1 Tax=Marmoricola sp. RAF53 TaxID=3233059 RepID=UPI003F9AA7A2
MIHLRLSLPSDLAESVIEELRSDPAVSSLSRLPGACVRPEGGDVIMVDVAREAANAVIERLHALGVGVEGTVHIEDVGAWFSRPAFEAERLAPGSSADAVVWADVTYRSYEESELNWTYGAFLTLATLIAAIAIVLDSQILTIGAMVIGPEFAPIAALGVALVRRRPALLRRAASTLAIGFVLAIALTTLAALAARALGWVTVEQVTADRPATGFIYTPDKWSFIVAVIAAAAGVLSLTSARVGGLSGVFISVTTVPAAGNIALGLAFGLSQETYGSSAQLLLNISAMAVAGWLTLLLQQQVWKRILHRRERFATSG